MNNSWFNPRPIKIVFVCITLCWGIDTVSFAAEDTTPSDASTLHVFTMVMGLFGGLALFLYGMEKMAAALKVATGEQLKTILAKLTTNRVTGALTGAAVTAIIQSSSVTTVLVVGFITAGVMSFSQAVGVILGINVGTTITAQIIAFQITEYSLLLVAVGFAMVFIGAQDRIKQYGAMVMGLGLLFFGMGVMSDVMKPLRSYQPFLDLMAHMKNPILGILIAAAFTGLVQSSSATTGIVIVMASQGFITLPAGITLIFGANIGTCVTALLASIGKPKEAIRAAVVHIVFNIIGVVIWIGFIGQLAQIVIWLSPVAQGVSGVEKLAAETPRQIANAHTIFNIANTIIFLPFAGLITRLVERLVSDKPAVEVESEATPIITTQLNPELLAVPSLAIEQAQRQIVLMAEVVRGMLADIMPAFMANDMRIIEGITRREDHVDHLDRQTTSYLTQIAHSDLSLQQSESIVKLLHVTTDLEHTSDVIAESLVALLVKKAEGNIELSEEGQEELIGYHQLVLESYERAIEAFENDDTALAQTVRVSKSELDQLERTYRQTHYNRLNREVQASVDSSHIHLDLVDYLRRINAYAESIARVTS
jgi:phosphate:Na+ symporter